MICQRHGKYRFADVWQRHISVATCIIGDCPPCIRGRCDAYAALSEGEIEEADRQTAMHGHSTGMPLLDELWRRERGCKSTY